jgi:MFS family permease
VAGTVILPLVLGILSASIWSGRRTARTGRYRRFPIAGCAIAAAGLAGLALVRTSTPPVVVGVCAGLVGVGVGVFGQVTNVAVQDAVPTRLVGTATSTVALVRELGVTLGAAALGGLLAARLLQGLGPLGDLARRSPEQLRHLSPALRHTYGEAYLSAMTPLFAALAVLFALAVGVALMLPDRQLSERVIIAADERHQPTYVPDSLP